MQASGYAANYRTKVNQCRRAFEHAKVLSEINWKLSAKVLKFSYQRFSSKNLDNQRAQPWRQFQDTHTLYSEHTLWQLSVYICTEKWSETNLELNKSSSKFRLSQLDAQMPLCIWNVAYFKCSPNKRFHAESNLFSALKQIQLHTTTASLFDFHARVECICSEVSGLKFNHWI